MGNKSECETERARNRSPAGIRDAARPDTGAQRVPDTSCGGPPTTCGGGTRDNAERANDALCGAWALSAACEGGSAETVLIALHLLGERLTIHEIEAWLHEHG